MAGPRFFSIIFGIPVRYPLFMPGSKAAAEDPYGMRSLRCSRDRKGEFVGNERSE